MDAELSLPCLNRSELLIVKHLLMHYTFEQLDMMARECDRCKERSPFWELRVSFENNHPRFISSAPSLEMPKPDIHKP